MPFVRVDIQEKIKEECRKSPAFKDEWEASRDEYRLIGEMIALRKKQHITQSRLAELSGNRQQVISRIEKKQNMPSLRSFCNLLNVLGYELIIQKKR